MGELAVIASRPSTNVDAFRASTDAAHMCRDVVLRKAVNIQGRRYIPVEGWMSIAVAHGCAASARSVERLEDGFRAIGEIRRMADGVIIAEAEGFVGIDEPVWFGGEVEAYGKVKKYQKRPDYAIRAMAQTRAISRAARSAFAHVVVLIDEGLSTVPAEEVPPEGLHDDVQEIDKLDRAIAQGSASPPVKGREGHPDFPEGPCKNVTALKAKWKLVKADLVAAGDIDSFDIVVSDNRAVLNQVRAALPSWWTGEGLEPGQGIGEWMHNRRIELTELQNAGDGERLAGDNGNTILDAG